MRLHRARMGGDEFFCKDVAMQDQSVMDFRKFKILVVAADPEVQGADALDLEVDDIRAAFRPEALGRLSIKPVSTLDPDTLAAEIRKFAPDVVHFTSRGTPGGFIRLSDRRVIIRSIVGTTLLHILRASDDISCVFMSGCRIFRNERVLAENIPLLAIAAPADAAWDISAIATNIFIKRLESRVSSNRRCAIWWTAGQRGWRKRRSFADTFAVSASGCHGMGSLARLSSTTSHS